MQSSCIEGNVNPNQRKEAFFWLFVSEEMDTKMQEWLRIGLNFKKNHCAATVGWESHDP